MYFNDYDLVINPSKLDATLTLVNGLLADGVPVEGIGFQMHIDTTTPSLLEIKTALAKAAATGFLVRISELDISVNQSEQLINPNSTRH